MCIRICLITRSFRGLRIFNRSRDVEPQQLEGEDANNPYILLK